MTISRFILISLTMISVAPITMGQQNYTTTQQLPPPSCPVTTQPEAQFTPPGRYEIDDSSFWFGSEKLWAVLRKSGVWNWAPRKPGHEQDVHPLSEKLFWMSVDFNWRTEESPDLKVTGRRLDDYAPPLLTTSAKNAFPGPGAAMLIGVYTPTPGCWEITGEYKGEQLSYVVWVKPINQ